MTRPVSLPTKAAAEEAKKEIKEKKELKNKKEKQNGIKSKIAKPGKNSTKISKKDGKKTSELKKPKDKKKKSKKRSSKDEKNDEHAEVDEGEKDEVDGDKVDKMDEERDDDKEVDEAATVAKEDEEEEAEEDGNAKEEAEEAEVVEGEEEEGQDDEAEEVTEKKKDSSKKEPKVKLDAESAMTALKEASKMWFDFATNDEGQNETISYARPTATYKKTERLSKRTRANSKKVLLRGGFIPLRRLRTLVKSCIPKEDADKLKVRKSFLLGMRTHLENVLLRKYVGANIIRCGKGKNVLTESDFLESSFLKLF